jgi:hypothetical protein
VNEPFKKVYEYNPYAMELKGRWRATLEDEFGHVKQVVEGDNVITTVGKQFLASFLVSAAAAASTFTCKYVAIGTDATAEAVGNTTLGTESARHTGTVAYVANTIFQVTATFAAGVGTGAIVEYGLLSSAAAGTLLSRDTESVINKGASDVLTVVCQVTVS